MRFDLRQLSYFVAVAEELNFTRAARRLSVAQQSLSSAVARLESHVGFDLFERSTRTVALTEHGSRWLPYARDLLAVAERCATAAHDISASGDASLRIGLAATAAVEITPRLGGIKWSWRRMTFQQFGEGLGWLRPFERLPWPPIQLRGHGIKFILSVQGQVGALREVLA